MNNKLFIAGIATLLTFGSVGFALAAPNWIFQRTVLPESNNAFDLGTTTGKVSSGVWRNIYANTASSTNLIVSSLGGTSDCLTASADGTITTTACGGSGTGTVSTSTNEIAGRLSYWTSNSATPALLGQISTTTLTLSGFPASIPTTLGALVGGSNTTWTWWGLATTSQPASSNLLVSNGGAGVFGVATGTVSASGGITVTAGRSAIGGALAITCSTADTSTTGCLTDTDWDTFNNKGSGTVTSIATTFPITGGTITTTGTLGWGGISTSSPISAGSGLLYATGVNTLASVSTSSAISMSITGLAGTATALASNPTNCSAGNYPLGIDASGNVESCTADISGTGVFECTPDTYSGTAVNATSTGLWLKATSPYSLVASSTFITYASTTQLTVSDIASSTSFVMGLGSAGTPALRFSGNENTGIYSSSASQIGFSTAGALKFTMGSNGFRSSGFDIVSENSRSFTIEGAAGTLSVPTYSFNSDLDTGLWSQYANALNLTVGGTEVFRSDVASTSITVGNFGIGTTSPGTRLSLGNTGTDTINISATATSTFGSGLNLRTGCFAIAGTCVGGGGSGTPGGSNGQLQYNNSSSFGGIGGTFFDNTKGTLGIGTSTPQWLVQLASSTAPQFALSDGSSSSNHWTFRNAGGILYIATSSASSFATSTVPAITIDTNGQVGIRTATPLSSLTIGSGQIFTPNGTAVLPSYSFTSNTNTGMYSPTNSQIAFSVGGVDGFRIRTIDGLSPGNTLGIMVGPETGAPPALFTNTATAISGPLGSINNKGFQWRATAAAPYLVAFEQTASDASQAIQLLKITNQQAGHNFFDLVGGGQLIFRTDSMGVLTQNGLTSGITSTRSSADAVSYAINARKSRGTVASPTVITTGDALLEINAAGYLGATNTYVNAAQIIASSTGTISDSTSGIGGTLAFKTAAVGTVGLVDRMFINSLGQIGIGTTTPITNLQVTATSTNATTTVTIGKTGQTKGSCLELFDAVGTVQYVSIVAGTLQISATSCK